MLKLIGKIRFVKVSGTRCRPGKDRLHKLSHGRLVYSRLRLRLDSSSMGSSPFALVSARRPTGAASQLRALARNGLKTRPSGEIDSKPAPIFMKGHE